MLASTLFFGLMAITIRFASRTLPTFEIAFFRNAVGLLVLMPLLLRSRASMRTTQLPKYLLRSAIGIGSMLCSFWAIGHLPLSQAVSLSYSTPLFVTIAAVLWLGEIVRRRRWTAVLLGFVGVLVIVRPGTSDFTHGSLIALAAAVLSAIVAIQIKQLSRVDAPDTIVFYTYLFWVPLSFVPALFVWQWPQPMAWLWLVLTGICGTGGQLLWTRALKIGDVSALTPISFMQLPVVSVAGMLLFNEKIDRYTVTGALIIFAANAYIAQREAQLARRSQTSAPVGASRPTE
ncbi:DMT family transporter [Lysobacter lacus]|uniref:DMT family transporter n=2 Tax=Cognatilysobacter lacus TaxID=1643323 RepID=A0A5D8Z3Q2_9GAMM|nr:DMT family transporter [Lysobacter lacus]